MCTPPSPVREVHSLAAVDDDVLRPAPALQHAHLGMVPAAPEEAGGLDTEVSDAFLVVVHETEAVLLQEPLVLLFDFLPQRNVWLTAEGVGGQETLYQQQIKFNVYCDAVAHQFLLFRHGLPDLRLGLKVVVDLVEVTLLQICDFAFFLRRHFL